MADIVREAQGAHLCALFIKAHGDSGHYEYALDAANSAAKHLQAILAELPATPHRPATPAYSPSSYAQQREICPKSAPQITQTNS